VRLSARFPKWANADLSQIINASRASSGLLCVTNIGTLKRLTSSTSEKTESYCSRKMIRAFVRSYGESSTETLSPGTIRMKCLRIFPEICARTLRWPGRSTRNIVPGNTCVTVPSVMICSSFAIARRIYRASAGRSRLRHTSGGLPPRAAPTQDCLRHDYRNWSSESVGKYSRSSSRFHHAPVWRSSFTVVNR